MSIENLREYTRRCATDPELRETAKTIGMMDLQGHMAMPRAWVFSGPWRIWMP